MSDWTNREQEAVPAGPQEGRPAVSPALPESFHSAARSDPGFFSFLNCLSGLILLGSVLLFAWLQATTPRLERVEAPARALDLMIGRSMDVEEVFAQAPAWEQWLFDLTMSDSGETLPLAFVWYEELASAYPDRSVRIRLGVLAGESGKLDVVRDLVRDLAQAQEPVLAGLLREAYLEGPAQGGATALYALPHELAPTGWFFDRLVVRLAAKAGNQPLVAATKAGQFARTEPLVRRARVLAGVQLLCMAAGVVALALIVVRKMDRQALLVGTAQVPPAWSGRAGAIVLLRGGAAGALLTLALLAFQTDNLLIRVLAIPLTNLPILFLADRQLLQPTGLGFVRGLGLAPLPGAWKRIGLVLAILLAAALFGEWALGRAAEAWDLFSHWTEWFDADLVWGSGALLAVSLVEYVFFAPLFEELVFRGLLFATLRRKFEWGMAAACSSGIFALAHGYGVLGTVSVFWSGLLWAWAYEKTGSLLPGMAAHMLNNLLVCATVMALLR